MTVDLGIDTVTRGFKHLYIIDFPEMGILTQKDRKVIANPIREPLGNYGKLGVSLL